MIQEITLVSVFKKILPLKTSHNNVMKTKDPIQKWKIFLFWGVWVFGCNFNPHFQSSSLFHGVGHPLNFG
jgi:hypothetical protein